jgi:hypothetical protein
MTKRLTPAQEADEERMRYAIETLGVIPFFDGNNYTNTHRRGPEGMCARTGSNIGHKKGQEWPCEAALRMLNAYHN